MSELNLTAPAPLPIRQQHLGRNLVIDLVLLLLAVLVISVIIPGFFLVLHVVQQGTSLAKLQGMQPDEILKIIGVPGIVTLLVLQNMLFVLLPVVRVIWLRREPIAALGWQLANPLRNIGLGIGLGVVILICNALVGLTFASFNMRQNQAAQYPLFPGDVLGQAAFFIGAAVLVPIGEEVLFRGYIFNTLQRMWGEQPWGRAAMFGVSAFIFSLAHAASASQDVLALLVPAFLMGLLLSYGMYRTGSLVPGIIAHALNNGLALTALLVCINNPTMCPNI